MLLMIIYMDPIFLGLLTFIRAPLSVAELCCAAFLAKVQVLELSFCWVDNFSFPSIQNSTSLKFRMIKWTTVMTSAHFVILFTFNMLTFVL